VKTIYPDSVQTFNAKKEFEVSLYSALETYSNVHRGNGQFSMISTKLFEQARQIVLDYLGLDKGKYLVFFSSPRSADLICSKLKPGTFQVLSCLEFGLSLGVRAVAVEKKALPKGPPLLGGGGTARLMSTEWVVWAKAPAKLEAGTPSVINIVAFAKALKLARHYGKNMFGDSGTEKDIVKEILYEDGLEAYTGKALLDKLREMLIGRNVVVSSGIGDRPYINFDNSASTPTFEPVWDAYRRSLFQDERNSKALVSEVKSICSGFLGAPADTYDMIFTSNTTEALNLAAENLGLETETGTEPVIVNTLLEHSSNDLPWRLLPGHTMIRLAVDDNGFIDPRQLESLLESYNSKGEFGRKRIKLLAISGASNVLGTCNRLEEISKLAHAYGAQLLVDAAQLVAHRKVDMEKTSIDYLAFSAHKIYAPFGSGMLVARKGLLKFSPMEMALIRNSGEENTAGIAALGKALLLLQRIGMDKVMEEEKLLTTRLLNGLLQIKGLSLFGLKDPGSVDFERKTGVFVFRVKGMMPDQLAGKLAAGYGIGIRPGCHCSHIIVKRLLKLTPFLENFQRLIVQLFPKLQLPGLARVSLGIENTEQEVDALLEALNTLINPGNRVAEKRNQDAGGRMQPYQDFERERLLEVYS
jgi:selenocysteine lyase/cysteine desulfurase